MSANEKLRILVVDDNPSIHEDFRKVLGGAGGGQLQSARALFLGASSAAPGTGQTDAESFEIDSAHQGEEGLACVKNSRTEARPYALAFVDVRMPPGWDGVKTIEHIWKEDPDLQTVICTAYSDYSWEETIEKLGRSDRLLIVKKPFDAIEIRQLASALTRKWSMTRRERTLIEELKRAERESRAYASSLETVNRALMTAKASADRSAQLKTDFLVQLGSQIQTQMQNICGRVALLKNPGALAAAELAHVDRILDASSYLMSVFDNILDLSLIETGKIEIERKPFSVTDVVRNLVSTFRPRAAQKNLDLDVEIRGPLPERIRTDAARFEQVLSELLDNAVRNTEYGSVRVVVRLEQTDDWREPILRLDVIDTGQGITEEHLGRAFEPFYRTPAEAGEHRPGLGLGLSRQLAQLLGGDLVVDTAPGRGSAFTFTLEAGNLEGVPMIE